MQSIAQFFSYLNDINFSYVVLRNWDNLPHSVEFEEHGDLDLLVYDLKHFEETMGDNISRVYSQPRVQYRIKIGNTFVQADIRYLGDGYYPYDFEDAILKTREWNKAGFFTPNSLHHRLALSYHAVHHKGRISKEYRRWLGDIDIKNLADALKQSSIGWCAPKDPTVGIFNSYTKGATGIVSYEEGSVRKTQYRFKDNDLISNEAKFLKLLDSDHFPKLISSDDGSLQIENCGKELDERNLPDDWKEQLTQILIELKQANITHRDLRIENLMVKDGVIKLIDFGWACKSGEEEKDKTPDLLGYPNKSPWGFNDSFSMGKIFKQIECKAEVLV